MFLRFIGYALMGSCDWALSPAGRGKAINAGGSDLVVLGPGRKILLQEG